MNKKILKLILAAALNLSLICAAQNANAMEAESVNTNVNTIKKNNLNNSPIDEKSKIIEVLKTLLKDLKSFF